MKRSRRWLLSELNSLKLERQALREKIKNTERLRYSEMEYVKGRYGQVISQISEIETRLLKLEGEET